MDAKKEPSALDVVGSRVLAQLAASQPAGEADLKALEAGNGVKLEVSARQMLETAAAFQKTLDDYAKTAAIAVLTTAPAKGAATEPAREVQDTNGPPRAVRHRLQDERAYPSGQPGEIFIKMAKEGSTVSGLMDAFATSISLALQHGVPLKVLCEKFAHTRFEPSGWTGNEQIGYAKSLMDYIFRWLNLRFLSGEQLTLFAGLAPQAPQLPASPTILSESEAGEEPITSQHNLARLAEEVAKRLNQVSGHGSGPAAGGGGIAPEAQAWSVTAGPAHMPNLKDRGIYHAADAMREMYEMGDAPSCSTCGAIMVRNGSCYRCMSCGSTSGCS
jgi:ribonucleoside-diphosphate reductase alpha chain